MKHVTLQQDNQLIDLGGGTAQVSLMIKDRLKVTKPVVCVDPSNEMLQVAGRNGAITVQATAEDFLKTKPPYPLRVVLMISCVHHLEDPDFVFSSLSRYMPSDGVCFIQAYPPDVTLLYPLFKAAKEAFAADSDSLQQRIPRLAEANGFKCELFSGSEQAEIDKELWYEAIRNRFISTLLKFTDAELEEGIGELEREFADKNVLKFDLNMEGAILTKT